MDYLKILKAIPENFELHVHILSHFNKLDEEYINLLTERYDINREDIGNRLLMTGSKFYENFALNPINLYEKILTGYKSYNKYITERETTTDISIIYPNDIYKSGIGIEGIININELSEKEKLNIGTETRRGFSVRTLHRKQEPVWELNIALFKNEDNKYHIKTIFPGKPAPPFPDKEFQGKTEYNISVEFWDKHIFLI